MTRAKDVDAFGYLLKTTGGPFLRFSDDFGRSWTNPQQAPIRFPSDSGMSLKNIWQIIPGGRNSRKFSIAAWSPPHFLKAATQEKTGP